VFNYGVEWDSVAGAYTSETDDPAKKGLDRIIPPATAEITEGRIYVQSTYTSTILLTDIVCFALFAVSLHFIMGPASLGLTASRSPVSIR
jgi:hypothetical protein